MRIVQVATEFAPIAKAGGLGEVVAGLSRELHAGPHQISVLIPKYTFIHPLPQLSLEKEFVCIEKGRMVGNRAWVAQVEGVNLHLIEPLDSIDYFQRDRIYGYSDDAARFLYFCAAILHYLKLRNEPIDVLHLHDWHTAACALMVKDLFKDLPIRCVVLTIHNNGYQGRCASWDLDAVGLSGLAYLTPDKLQDPVYFDTINLLKGGICYADAVNTVSPSYAKEIILPGKGEGLEKILQRVKPTGILNGIDVDRWDPGNDVYLSGNYTANAGLESIREAKLKSKRDLEKKWKLSLENAPLIGVVSRLVPEKGADILLDSIEDILESGAALIVVGSATPGPVKNRIEQLQQRFLGHPRLFLKSDYEEACAHQLFAASDFVLIPSLFEPCGLTPLIALRYGALPISHATGGLQDTVFDCDEVGGQPLLRNGFLFREPTVEALVGAVRRAVMLWRKDRLELQWVARKAMQANYDWQRPAGQYEALYEQLVAKKQTVVPVKDL